MLVSVSVCCLHLSAAGWEHIAPQGTGTFLIFVLSSRWVSLASPAPFSFLGSAHPDLPSGVSLLVVHA